MKLFAEESFQSRIKQKLETLKHEVKNTEISRLENIHFETQLENSYGFQIPEIHFDNVTVSVQEEVIPDPKKEGAEIVVLAIVYRLPVSGDIGILKNAATKRNEIEVDLLTTTYTQAFSIKLFSIERDPKLVVEEYNKILEVIKSSSGEIISAAEKWNYELRELISTEIERREKAVKQIRSFISALGVPELQ